MEVSVFETGQGCKTGQRIQNLARKNLHTKYDPEQIVIKKRGCLKWLYLKLVAK